MDNPHFTADNPGAAVAALREAYPGVTFWFGTHTGHYWALVGGRFVEADHPAELAHQLEEMRRRAMTHRAV